MGTVSERTRQILSQRIRTLIRFYQLVPEQTTYYRIVPGCLGRDKRPVLDSPGLSSRRNPGQGLFPAAPDARHGRGPANARISRRSQSTSVATSSAQATVAVAAGRA